MKGKKIAVAALLVFLLLGLSLVMWKVGSLRERQTVTPELPHMSIRIGSKDFTENVIVSEMYALALEDAGFKVERVPQLSGSLIHTALVTNEIDVYPEYTGTGLLSILKERMETDPEKVYQKVKQGYEKQFQLIWLDYAPANDSQGLVIRTELAEQLGIATISDLQRHAAELRFASQGEFNQREDGLLGLERVYGEFKWKSSKVYENSLKYALLENGEADVIPAYTTEGQLVRGDLFTLLEDDRSFWPPYNLAPVVREETLKNHPEMATILNDLSKKLNTETLTELNAKVDVEGQDAIKVARRFYELLRYEEE